MFVYNQLPFCIEYFIEERLGYQFIYSFHKTPFFANANTLNEGVIANHGHGFEFMQKFYHPYSSLGTMYFGHSIRYKTINYTTNVHDTTTGSDKIFSYKLKQSSFEYSVVGGDRIFLKNKSDYPGWTIDIYIGLAVGKLTNNYSTSLGYFPPKEIFEDVNQQSFYATGKLGISIGYMF